MTKRTLAVSLLFALALAPLGAQPVPGKEELKLKLPKPMFIGTPTNIKSPNLEVVTGKSRAPFYVPKGTVLLSLKKPAAISLLLRHGAIESAATLARYSAVIAAVPGSNVGVGL